MSDWQKVQTLISDVNEMRFYEIIGMGTKDLKEAARLLRPLESTQ